jgi:hypothetical protein
VAKILRALVASIFILAFYGAALAQYNPIPNYTGTDAGQLFRNDVNNRFGGQTPISPALVKYYYASLPPEQDGQSFYCPDCQQTNPCSQGNTTTGGAYALGVHGVWLCGGQGNGGIGALPNGDIGGQATNLQVLSVLGGRVPIYATEIGAQFGQNIIITGLSSGSLSLAVPATIASGTLFTLPANNGSPNYVLGTDGAGHTAWVAQASGGSNIASYLGAINVKGTGTTGADSISHVNVDGVFDVTDFGAVCDGATDDTAAIASALSAGAGYMVLFPRTGHLCHVASTLTVPASTVLIGEGFNTGLSGSGITILSTGTNTSIALHDMAVVDPTGNSATIAVSGGINLGHIELDHVLIGNLGSSKLGIGLLLNGASQWHVHDSTISGWNEGVALEMNGSTKANGDAFLGNRIGANNIGVHIHAAGSDDAYFQAGTFDANAINYAVEGGTNVVFSGNRFVAGPALAGGSVCSNPATPLNGIICGSSATVATVRSTNNLYSGAAADDDIIIQTGSVGNAVTESIGDDLRAGVTNNDSAELFSVVDPRNGLVPMAGAGPYISSFDSVVKAYAGVDPVPMAIANLPLCNVANQGLVEAIDNSVNTCTAGAAITAASSGGNICGVQCGGSAAAPAWNIVGTVSGGGSSSAVALSFGSTSVPLSTSPPPANSYLFYNGTNISGQAAPIPVSLNGAVSNGRLVGVPIADPAAPLLSGNGTGSVGGTYYLVCHDNGHGHTNVGGSAAIGASYSSISLTWTGVTGCTSWDVLKNGTTTSIGTNIAATNFTDSGQATAAYTAPTANTTQHIVGTLIPSANPIGTCVANFAVTGFYSSYSCVAGAAVQITLNPTWGEQQVVRVAIKQPASGTLYTPTFVAATGAALGWANGTGPTAPANNGEVDVYEFIYYPEFAEFTGLQVPNVH